MKLSSIFIAAFGIGVISYPAIHLPYSATYFVDNKGKQAEPVPKPEKKGKTDFAINYQKDKEYHIIVNIPATKLVLYEDGVEVMELNVAVGQAIYKTPTGHDEIKELIWNPWWYPPKSDWAKDEEITPPGPRNPLGPVKMVLGDEIRLHGTTKDSSIGRAASHGCIRMHSKDAITLAWYLQSHLTDKSDESYLEKYKKFSSSTFHVKLDKAVRVDLIYKTVAFNDDSLILYPDVYNKVSDMKEIAAWELYNNGILPWEFNLAKITKPNKITEEISIMDLR